MFTLSLCVTFGSFSPEVFVVIEIINIFVCDGQSHADDKLMVNIFFWDACQNWFLESIHEFLVTKKTIEYLIVKFKMVLWIVIVI